MAPLPKNWKPCKTKDTEDIYYFNFSTGESTWDHPCDGYYKRLYEEEKKKKETMKKESNDMQRTEAKKTVEKLTGKAERKKKKKDQSESVRNSADSLGSIQSKSASTLTKKPLPEIRPKLSSIEPSLGSASRTSLGGSASSLSINRQSSGSVASVGSDVTSSLEENLNASVSSSTNSRHVSKLKSVVSFSDGEGSLKREEDRPHSSSSATMSFIAESESKSEGQKPTNSDAKYDSTDSLRAQHDSDIRELKRSFQEEISKMKNEHSGIMKILEREFQLEISEHNEKVKKSRSTLQSELDKMEDECKQREKRYNMKLNEIDQAEEDLQRRVNGHEEKKSDYQDDIRSKDAIITSLKTTISSLEQDLEEKKNDYQDDIRSKDAIITSLKTTISSLEQDLSGQKDRHATSLKEVAELKAIEGNLRIQLRELKDEVDNLGKDNKRLSAQVSAYDKIENTDVSPQGLLKSQLDAERAISEASKEQIKELETKLEKTENDKDQLILSVNNQKDELEKRLESEVAALKANNNSKRAEIEACNARINRLTMELKYSQQDLQRSNDRIEELQSDNSISSGVTKLPQEESQPSKDSEAAQEKVMKLEEEKSKLLKQLDIEREDKKVAENMVLANEKEHTENVANLQTQMITLRHNLEKSSNQLIEKNQELLSLQKRHDELADAKSSLESSCVSLSADNSRVLVQIGELKEKLKHNEEMLASKDTLLQDLRSQLSVRSVTSSGETDQKDNQIQILDTKLVVANDRIREMTTKISKLQGTIFVLEQEVDVLKKERISMEKENNDVKTEIAARRASESTLKDKLSIAEQTIQGLERAKELHDNASTYQASSIDMLHDKYSNEIVTLAKEIESLKMEKGLLSKNFDVLDSKYTVLETQQSSLIAENNALKIKTNDYVNEINSLKKSLDVRITESQNTQHQLATMGTVISSTDDETMGGHILFTKVAGHEEEISNLKRHKLTIESALVKQQNSVNLLSNKLAETEKLIQNISKRGEIPRTTSRSNKDITSPENIDTDLNYIGQENYLSDDSDVRDTSRANEVLDDFFQLEYFTDGRTKKLYKNSQELSMKIDRENKFIEDAIRALTKDKEYVRTVQRRLEKRRDEWKRFKRDVHGSTSRQIMLKSSEILNRQTQEVNGLVRESKRFKQWIMSRKKKVEELENILYSEKVKKVGDGDFAPEKADLDRSMGIIRKLDEELETYYSQLRLDMGTMPMQDLSSVDMDEIRPQRLSSWQAQFLSSSNKENERIINRTKYPRSSSLFISNLDSARIDVENIVMARSNANLHYQEHANWLDKMRKEMTFPVGESAL